MPPGTFYLTFQKNVNFLHHFADAWRADRDMGEGIEEPPALFPVNSDLPGNLRDELEVTRVCEHHVRRVYKT